jgi:hypothetical protein
VTGGVRLAVVIPTRDRPELAALSARSVAGDAVVADVVVSDNSTDEEQRAALVLPQGVRVIRPDQPLPMVAHWQFALDAVLADPGITHVAFLTDRMVCRPGELGRIATVCRALPDLVVSFDTDAVLDFDRPARVHLNPWSGAVYEVPAQVLLAAASHSRPASALPRMLNCVVPRAVLEAVAARYGSVFASVAPDYCFAFRCLTVIDRLAFYDRAAYVHHASGRSNGANLARGTGSPDSQRFAAELDRPLYANAPVPGLHGVLNAIMSEYGFVRAESGDLLPEVDLADYLAAVDRDLDAVVDEDLRRQQLALLLELGHQHVPFHQWRRAERVGVARSGSRQVVGRAVARLAGLPASRQLWQRTGQPPPSAEWFGWADPDEALAFAVGFGRRRSPRRVPPGAGRLLLRWDEVNG